MNGLRRMSKVYPYTMNCRAKKIPQQCQELGTLKKQGKRATEEEEEEKQSLVELHKILWKKLITLKKKLITERSGAGGREERES